MMGNQENLQGTTVINGTPNVETLKAISEVEKMIARGTGEHFTGITSDFFEGLLEK